MKRLRTFFGRFGIGDTGDWLAPVLIFLVCFYSFGLLLFRLGFFQDDWHHVFYSFWQGAQGLQRFLMMDRGPFAWIVYAFFFKILGYSPAAWHWSLMLIRFLTAAAFWLALRLIWPRRASLTAWLALLFVIYPIFTLQPLAVAYTLHWVMYLAFMLSLLVMLEAARRPRAFAPLTALALLLEAIHLVLIEYFAGLELSRLLFLWLLLANLPSRPRLKETLRQALPYLIVLLLYVVYRSSYGALFGYDRFTPLATVIDVMRTPMAGLRNILQSLLQDLVYVILSQWYAAVDPAIIDLARPSTYFIFASATVFAAGAYLAFVRLDRLRPAADLHGPGAQAAAAGVLSVVLAILPFWVTGFSIYQKNQLWSERLALAAMPGASMLVVGAVHAMIERSQYRHLVLSALLGLGISLHGQTARSFQASWDKQEQFYWQMHWRAPSLKANTMLVSDQEILFYMGIYPTAFAVNLLYPQITAPPEASYWFNAGFEHLNFDAFAAGKLIPFEKYATIFTAGAQNVVAITFEPGLDQCLWILGPQLANVRGLTPEASTWLEVSNPARILAAPETMPPRAIFGDEPQRTWCYYYEKADLASQSQEWSRITGLWREAAKHGLRAPNGIELIPFISAFARLNDWEAARGLTTQAQALPDRSSSVLCDLWRNLESGTSAAPKRDQTIARVQAELGCQK
jgi:hypothetical protein